MKSAFFTHLPKLIKYGFVLAVVFTALSFVSIMALIAGEAKKEAGDGHDVVIVLGAGLRGDQITNVLKSRLDTAIHYAEKNPDALLMMSGGQGEDEWVSEAFAMKEYAISRGIDCDRILMEDQSTSTGENLTYSKAILDTYFEDDDYTALIVSSDYHLFRAGFCAWQLGMEYESAPAAVPHGILPRYILREYVAVLKYVLVSI